MSEGIDAFELVLSVTGVADAAPGASAVVEELAAGALVPPPKENPPAAGAGALEPFSSLVAGEGEH